MPETKKTKKIPERIAPPEKPESIPARDPEPTRSPGEEPVVNPENPFETSPSEIPAFGGDGYFVRW